MKKLFALILCVVMLFSMAACKQPTNPTPQTDPNDQSKKLYTQASDVLGSASHVTLELLVTTVTTVDGDEFSEQSTQTLTYQDMGTDKAVIALEESLLFSVHNEEEADDEEKADPISYKETWHQDTVYTELKDTYRFQSAAPKATVVSRYIPIILLNAELYGTVTQETTETGTVIRFAQPTAGESWAIPQDAKLAEASGSAHISPEGVLTQMDYTITYDYGPVQVKQTVQSKPWAIPRFASAPSDRDSYIPVGYADALRTSVCSFANLMQVDSLTFSCTNNLTSEAAAYVENESIQVNLHGRREKTIAKLDTSIYCTDYTTMKSDEYEQEELFLDNKLTTTVNKGLPASDSSVGWKDVRNYIATVLSAVIYNPDYWKDATVADLGFANLIEFQMNDNFGNYIQNGICSMLWDDPSFLVNLASKYETNEVTGYLSVDKYTGLPIAVGYYYKGTHTIEGRGYSLIQQFDQSITTPSKGAYQEITGKRPTEKEPESKPTPLFYKVTGKDGQQMYLFGTIHVGDERTAYLPDEIRKAFSDSDALALECNTELFEKKAEEDSKLAEQVSGLYYLTDESKLMEKLMDKDDYKKACQYLKAAGGNNGNMPYARPFLWADLIEQFYLHQGHQLHADQGVEIRLIDWAEELDKDILEIESVIDQLKMTANFSDDLQLLLLESAMETTSQEYWEEAMDLYEKWCSGDEATLRELIRHNWDDLDMTEEELTKCKPLFDEYYKAMDTDRNKGMLNTAVDYLESGKVVFYAVGLAHLLDDSTGLVNTLRQAGYTVEQVAYQ